MQVYVKGNGTAVNLSQREYVGQGGEGVVYAKSGIGYKVYHDPAKMLPMGKFQELQAISDPRVVRPTAVLVDKSGKPIGYTAPFIDNAWTLCQLFPRIFLKRNNVTPKMLQNLVEKLRGLFSSVHKAGVLIVDANEMNFLVSHGFDEVYGIDSDSYQTRSYPATAIMESIRDWSVSGHQWTEGSDWYSFAIVSFQMFTGIHPFKGRYRGSEQGLKMKLPTDDEDDDFAVTRRRMASNISVFHPEVRMPKAALPVSAIPEQYRDWYEQLFTKGLRLPPPNEFGVVVFVPKVKALTGTNLLEILERDSFDGPLVSMWSNGTNIITVTDKKVWMDGRPKVPAGTVSGIAFTPRASRPVVVTHDGGVPVLTDLNTGLNIPFHLHARQVMVHDGRIYLRGREQVHEVILTDMSGQVVASSRVATNILEHATRLYPGVAIQKMLGSTFASLFMYAGAAQQVRIKELDDYRIVDAKYDGASSYATADLQAGGVLMVLGEKKGRYDRLVFRFDQGCVNYDVRKVRNVTMGDLNFVVLDTGVCVCLTEDEKLELFSARMGSTSIKTVEDPVLGGDMKLTKHGGQVLFMRGEKLYSMKLK